METISLVRLLRESDVHGGLKAVGSYDVDVPHARECDRDEEGRYVGVVEMVASRTRAPRKLNTAENETSEGTLPQTADNERRESANVLHGAHQGA
jgi:hypothetical protein